MWTRCPSTTKVALRKESVDRNLLTSGDVTAPSASLSARRAWIEMDYDARVWAGKATSLSARRAWIEIARVCCSVSRASSVALRKESVDRNFLCDRAVHQVNRRSPQGERG